MKIPIWATVLLMLCATFTVYGSETFEIIEQWNHGEKILGNIQDYVLDDDGWLFGGFEGTEGKLVITPDKTILYAPFGQGPSDLVDLRCVIPYKNSMGVVEVYGKVKLFTKENNTYVSKTSKWFKTTMNTQIIQDGLFYDNKWFFAGHGEYYSEKKLRDGESYDVYYVRVCDDDGNIIKQIVRDKSPKGSMFHLMRYFLDKANGKVFFMSENELKVKIICPKKLVVEKEVTLEKPNPYKEMPSDYYRSSPKIKRRDGFFMQEYEKWKTTYSNIMKMLIEGDYLVVQLRTGNEDKEKFVLLFYNNKTFKLEKTIFLNDLLMTARDGKYYFFAGGEPKYDEVDEIVINIRQFKKENKK